MEVRTVAEDQEVDKNIKEQRGNETEDFNRRQEKKAGCKDSKQETHCASVVCERTDRDRKDGFVAWVCALTHTVLRTDSVRYLIFLSLTFLSVKHG